MNSGLSGVAAPPPVGGSLSFRLECFPKGTILHRIHGRQFGATAFNPGFGNSRFAPFAVARVTIPTAYAATSLECATFEAVFHDVDPAAAFRTVPLSALERLSYSTFELGRDLQLATFY
jgi:hypothetical protein